MKALYVNQYAIPPTQPGGTRHFEFSKILQSYNLEVSIVAGDYSHTGHKYFVRDSPDNHNIVSQKHDGVLFHWLYTMPYPGNNWRRAVSMLRFGWIAYWAILKLPKPDVIIGSSPHLFGALAAERAAAYLGVPFFLEIRDLYPQTLVDVMGRESMMSRVLQKIADHLYRRASKIITMARGTDVHLLERLIPAGKIVYVPNSVETSLFKVPTAEARQQTRQKLGLPQDRCLFVYAGTLAPSYALEHLLKAGELLKNDPSVGIVLIGGGPSKAGLKLQAEQMGLNNVYFADPIPKSEIPDFLGSMDAGILHLGSAGVYKYGISPNKLFDYFAARLPVVANVPGEMGDMILKQNAGEVVEPDNPGQFAEAIRKWSLSAEKRREAGERGRAFVEREFERKVLASRLAQAIENPTST